MSTPKEQLAELISSMRIGRTDTGAGCSTCRFYQPDGAHDYGECHRSPPRVYEATSWAFPIVKSGEWCGEWMKEKP